MSLLIAPLLALQTLSAGTPTRPETDATAAATREDQDIAQIRVAIAAGRLDEAAALIGLADAAHPDGQPAMLTLAKAELALEKGSTAQAAEIARALPTTGALHCGVARARALAMAERAPAEAAIDSLAAVTEQCSADWRVWRALGTLLAQRGQKEASGFAFSQALQLSPSPGMIRNDHARALIGAGDIDAAAELLRITDDGPAPDRETIRLRDFIAGMRGFEPVRTAIDSDKIWAQRLVDAAQGARRAGREPLARALISEALLVSPRFDRQLLAEAQIP
jgi:Flp pilus assembly protein TadD